MKRAVAAGSFALPTMVAAPSGGSNALPSAMREVVRYIEDNWGLGRIGTSDKRATSIIDCFDDSQKPRKFVKIAAKYPTSYFLNKPPSYLPVDTDM